VSHYQADIDLNNRNTSHTQVVELVGTDRLVLDVGCADGSLGRVLAERGCVVSGIDVDQDAARAAAGVLKQVKVADLNSSPLTDHFEPASFDVLVFADVLEHLLDPERVLRAAVGLLKPGGHIVVSVPNVAHGSLRLALLQGRWRYRATGLLDDTHIRFFTQETLIELFRRVGLAVETLRSTVADPLDVEVEIDDSVLLPLAVDWVRHQPTAMDYQYVAAVRVATDDDDLSRWPVVEPATPYEQVRRTDAHTERMERDRQERHDLLIMRDHVIGLEAAAAAAREREESAKERLRRTTALLKKERKAREEELERPTQRSGFRRRPTTQDR
jgi:methionine biosynthesis protein MetW